jgi:MFS family permease
MASASGWWAEAVGPGPSASGVTRPARRSRHAPIVARSERTVRRVPTSGIVVRVQQDDSTDELVTLRALALMLARGSVNGTVAPYGTVILLKAGLTPALLGPLAALGAIATLLAAPTWGRLGDRHGRRRMLAIAMLVAAPVALAHATGLVGVVAVAYVLWAAVSAAFIPLSDSLILGRLRGDRSRFARVRVGASGMYMLVVVLLGGLVSGTALGWAAPGILGFGFCLVAAAGVAARLRGELISGTGVAVHGGTGLVTGILAGVRRNRRFLVGLALVFAGSTAPTIFTGPRVAEVGGSGWEVGLAIAAGTLVELPAFLVLPWMLRAFGGRRMFVTGGVLLGVAGLTSALAPTPGLLIAARLLFGAGYAWVVLPSLAAISAAAAPGEHAASAALHFATQAAGSLVVALAGLPLVAATGSVAAVLAVAALAAPVGALIALGAWPRAASAVPAPARADSSASI